MYIPRIALLICMLCFYLTFLEPTSSQRVSRDLLDLIFNIYIFDIFAKLIALINLN